MRCGSFLTPSLGGHFKAQGITEIVENVRRIGNGTYIVAGLLDCANPNTKFFPR